MAGVAVIAGIGFTVALFVAQLAFDDPAITEQSRLAVLVASTIAGIAGYLVLRIAVGRTSATELAADAAADSELFD